MKISRYLVPVLIATSWTQPGRAQSAAFLAAYQDALCSSAGYSIESVQARQDDARYAREDRTQWFLADSAPKAVVLMIHGVVMRASRMNPLMQPIRADGFDVLRATLYGHGGSKEERGHATREKWLDNVLESYCIARERADSLHVPLYFVGYSLGALVNMDLMNAGIRQAVRYDRMVLFSPALALRWRILQLRPLWPVGILFARDMVTLFRALIDSYEHLSSEGFAAARAPTRVFLDPKDELVDIGKLRDSVRRFDLPDWTITEVSNAGHTEKRAHHITFYPPALGEAEWNRMISGMLEFLNQPKGAEHLWVTAAARSPAEP